ncbi:Ferredoxin 2Fe-2S [Bienertia sinuspersici]
MSISANIHSQSFCLLHSPSNPTFSISNCTSKTPSNQPSLPKNPKIEIRVCTTRTCRRQGSLQILETLLGVSPPHVNVNSCGCLGHCGSGPNLVVLPSAAMVSHCGTAACAADLMFYICGGEGDNDVGGAKRSLDSLAFRKRGEVEFQKQNFSDAEVLFSQVNA